MPANPFFLGALNAHRSCKKAGRCESASLFLGCASGWGGLERVDAAGAVQALGGRRLSGRGGACGPGHPKATRFGPGWGKREKLRWCASLCAPLAFTTRLLRTRLTNHGAGFFAPMSRMYRPRSSVQARYHAQSRQPGFGCMYLQAFCVPFLPVFSPPF